MKCIIPKKDCRVWKVGNYVFVCNEEHALPKGLVGLHCIYEEASSVVGFETIGVFDSHGGQEKLFGKFGGVVREEVKRVLGGRERGHGREGDDAKGGCFHGGYDTTLGRLFQD